MRSRYGFAGSLAFLLVFSFLVGLPLTGPASAAAPQEDRYGGMKRFSHVYDYVRRFYVREPSNEELMTGAIKGMLQGLDPHSSFLTPDEFNEMKETTSGEFVGIGIEISQENGQLIVVAPIDDTPAAEAGLKSGDLILAVDNYPTQDMTLQESVSKIRGVKDTEVELLILSKDSSSPRIVRIKRDSIPVVSVRTRPLGPGYTWLRVSRFSDNTVKELKEALAAAAAKDEIKGIVLDLRNNPGGLLDQAYKMADVFLRSGVIVSIKGRDKDEMREYTASSTKDDISAPLVVLVNAGSASASEIVAGALQDHKRALLMGDRTFGKGSVQNVIPMPDGSALKLTVALYYTPSGRSIQAEGIEPDMLVPYEPPREGSSTPRFNSLREQDLTGHLEKGANGKDATTETGEKNAKGGDDEDRKISPEELKSAPASRLTPAKIVSTGNEDVDKILERDNQLRLALEMVKALPKLQQIKAE